MKKILLPIVLSGAVAVFIAFSCNKTNNPNNTVNVGTTTSLNQLFAGLRYTPQSLSVAAGRDTMVFGTKGTMLHFYTNSFKNANGTTITSGTINLQLVEMYKPGDMISNRATTLAGGQLLQSGGEISIIATMNGQKVYANRYGAGFIQASQSQQPMQLFLGNNNNGDSVTNWAVAGVDSVIGIAANGTDSANFIINNAYGRSWVGYVFDSSSGDSSSSIEYTNCDAFYSATTALTSVSVIVPDTSFNPNTTEVYIILPSINCAMSTIEPELGSAGYNAATNTISLISEGNTNLVPTGMAYELVVVANKNGQYYYYTQSGTIPSGGLTATVTMAAETQSYVATKLAAL